MCADTSNNASPVTENSEEDAEQAPDSFKRYFQRLKIKFSNGFQPYRNNSVWIRQEDPAFRLHATALPSPQTLLLPDVLVVFPHLLASPDCPLRCPRGCNSLVRSKGVLPVILSTARNLSKMANLAFSMLRLQQ